MSHAWRYDPDMPIDTVLRRWPSAITVLIRHHMLCVGCPIGTFHTVPEICAAHEVDEAHFVRDMEAAIATSANSGEQEDVATAQG